MQQPSPVKRKIVLHGHLAKLFGESFDLAVRSPAEAMRLLEANFPGRFAKAFKIGSYQVAIVNGAKKFYASLETVKFNFPPGEFHFIPVPDGAGGSGSKGILMVILGVALIATAFIGAALFAGGAIAGLSATAIPMLGTTWGQIGMFGLALGLSGVANMLAPQPKDDKGSGESRSFFFNGAENITEEGVPVPLAYGRGRFGSVVVSAGVTVERIDIQSGKGIRNQRNSRNVGGQI